MTGVRLSWVEIDRLILAEYIFAGLSAREVAAMMDWQLPMHSIYIRATRLRKRLGIWPSDRVTTAKVDWDLVPELRAETATTADIAEFFDVTEYNIKRGRQRTAQLRERAKARARGR